MNLHYEGQAYVFTDEAGKTLVLTLEQAKAICDTMTQTMKGKGSVVICNAETKAKEAAQKEAAQKVT